MLQGTIKMLKDGYGFIATADGDVFFHANNLDESVDYDSLESGTVLEFEMGEGRNGKEQAVEITIAEDQSAATTGEEA